jgi:hypothetical protein
MSGKNNKAASGKSERLFSFCFFTLFVVGQFPRHAYFSVCRTTGYSRLKNQD